MALLLQLLLDDALEASLFIDHSGVKQSNSLTPCRRVNLFGPKLKPFAKKPLCNTICNTIAARIETKYRINRVPLEGTFESTFKEIRSRTST